MRVSEKSVCPVEGGMRFPGTGSMCSICESEYLLENHGVCLYVKQSIIYYTDVLRGVCVCVWGGGGGEYNTHNNCFVCTY